LTTWEQTEYLKVLTSIFRLNAFILVGASQENTSRPTENAASATMVFIVSILLKRSQAASRAMSMGVALEEISLHQLMASNESL
jgi:hypothetical protein